MGFEPTYSRETAECTSRCATAPFVETLVGIEPTSSQWKCNVLSLYTTASCYYLEARVVVEPAPLHEKCGVFVHYTIVPNGSADGITQRIENQSFILQKFNLTNERTNKPQGRKFWHGGIRAIRTPNRTGYPHPQMHHPQKVKIYLG